MIRYSIYNGEVYSFLFHKKSSFLFLSLNFPNSNHFFIQKIWIFTLRYYIFFSKYYAYNDKFRVDEYYFELRDLVISDDIMI